MTPSTNNLTKTSICKSLLSGILVTVLIVLLKWGAEHTTLYQEIQRACYGWLQARLSPPHRREDLPIMIVDIRNLEYTTIVVEGEKYSVTPRKELMALIEAVAAQKPRVIGIDIDFSPNKIGFVDLEDPVHFRRLLNLRPSPNELPVPVFVGIHRSRNLNREMWLGSPEFAPLAANVASPDDNRKMFEWTSDGGAQRGLTICKALADAFAPEGTRLGKYASWVVRQVSETQTEDGRKAGEFLVDFSSLGALTDTRLKTTNPNVIRDQGWTLTDKAVLIGDGSLNEARDSIIVPVQGQSRPVPGIYLHASAAYTLIKSPIYELTAVARFLADFLLAFIVLTCVIALRIYLRSSRLNFAETRATYFFIFLVTLVVVVLGIVFVHRTRVLWDDFAFVILGLWLHPVVESSLSPTWKVIKGIPTVLNPFFSNEKD